MIRQPGPELAIPYWPGLMQAFPLRGIGRMWRCLFILRAMVVDLSPLRSTVTAASLMVKSLISAVTDTRPLDTKRVVLSIYFVFFILYPGPSDAHRNRCSLGGSTTAYRGARIQGPAVSNGRVISRAPVSLRGLATSLVSMKSANILFSHG
jgi:hypothetical protein